MSLMSIFYLGFVTIVVKLIVALLAFKNVLVRGWGAFGMR